MDDQYGAAFDWSTLFPMPKVVEPGAGNLILEAGSHFFSWIMANDRKDPLLREAALLLQNEIGHFAQADWPAESTRPAETAIPIEIEIDQGCDLPLKSETAILEGYGIWITSSGIRIAAPQPAGILYGVQTLMQLIRQSGNQLLVPCVRIIDWPDLRWRGIFMENRYGTDKMTIHDWREAIDHLSRLKMNLLGVGVYGCWCLQYDNRVSEYWYLPLKNYPDLKSEQLIRYYSPRQERWIEDRYWPAMYQEDSFAEIIAYGRQRNVTVRPHFNSLGHNTLLPRLFPETAAVDAAGRKQGYSFCTAQTQTYDLLFAMI